MGGSYRLDDDCAGAFFDTGAAFFDAGLIDAGAFFAGGFLTFGRPLAIPAVGALGLRVVATVGRTLPLVCPGLALGSLFILFLGGPLTRLPVVRLTVGFWSCHAM